LKVASLDTQDALIASSTLLVPSSIGHASHNDGSAMWRSKLHDLHRLHHGDPAAVSLPAALGRMDLDQTLIPLLTSLHAASRHTSVVVTLEAIEVVTPDPTPHDCDHEGVEAGR
jgi:hypothetical protein